jgi:hypothetical protein
MGGGRNEVSGARAHGVVACARGSAAGSSRQRSFPEAARQMESYPVCQLFSQSGRRARLRVQRIGQSVPRFLYSPCFHQ